MKLFFVLCWLAVVSGSETSFKQCTVAPQNFPRLTELDMAFFFCYLPLPSSRSYTDSAAECAKYGGEIAQESDLYTKHRVSLKPRPVMMEEEEARRRRHLRGGEDVHAIKRAAQAARDSYFDSTSDANNKEGEGEEGKQKDLEDDDDAVMTNEQWAAYLQVLKSSIERIEESMPKDLSGAVKTLKREKEREQAVKAARGDDDDDNEGDDYYGSLYLDDYISASRVTADMKKEEKEFAEEGATNPNQLQSHKIEEKVERETKEKKEMTEEEEKEFISHQIKQEREAFKRQELQRMKAMVDAYRVSVAAKVGYPTWLARQSTLTSSELVKMQARLGEEEKKGKMKREEDDNINDKHTLSSPSLCPYLTAEGEIKEINCEEPLRTLCFVPAEWSEEGEGKNKKVNKVMEDDIPDDTKFFV